MHISRSVFLFLFFGLYWNIFGWFTVQHTSCLSYTGSLCSAQLNLCLKQTALGHVSLIPAYWWAHSSFWKLCPVQLQVTLKHPYMFELKSDLKYTSGHGTTLITKATAFVHAQTIWYHHEEEIEVGSQTKGREHFYTSLLSIYLHYLTHSIIYLCMWLNFWLIREAC